MKISIFVGVLFACSLSFAGAAKTGTFESTIKKVDGQVVTIQIGSKEARVKRTDIKTWGPLAPGKVVTVISKSLAVK